MLRAPDRGHRRSRPRAAGRARVVAAAVILDPERPIDGLRDSKLLTPAQRDRLAAEIRAHAPRVGRRARRTSPRSTSSTSCRRPCSRCARAVDGARRSRRSEALDRRQPLPGACRARRARSSAAIAMSRRFRRRRSSPRPRATRCWSSSTRAIRVYGFAHNKGYGTPEHLAALATHGPCPAHRRSFAPVRQPSFDF